MSKEVFREKASAIFRQMRAYRGITQGELFEKSNVAKSTLSAIEKGSANPRLDTLQAIADALECKITFNLEPLDK